MNETFLTSNEAAAYLRITRDRLYKNTELTYYSPKGGRRLYKKEDLDRWIESGKRN